MSVYRATPLPIPPKVVRYSPSSMLAKLTMALFLVALGGGSFYGAIDATRTLVLSCGRLDDDDARGCVLDRSVLFFHHDQVVVRVSDPPKTRLATTQGKGGPRAKVVLVLDDCSELALGRSDALDLRTRQEDSIDAELRRTTSARLAAPIEYDRVQPWPLIFLTLLGAFVLAMTVFVFGHTVLSFDLSRGVLHTTEHRWPRRRIRHSYPLDTIASLAIASRTGSKGGVTYVVELVTTHGTRIPLSESTSANRKRQERAAAVIDAVLAAWRRR